MPATNLASQIQNVVPHALFVAFHYPPEASSSGVLRTLKYSRYLPEHGWRVSVITPKESAYSVRDPKLEDQIPTGTKVVRTPYLNTKRDLSIRGIYPALFALPDIWVGWMPWAISAGKRLMASDPVDVIYSTSPHATAHLIAARLARAASKPWVADFRDPWIEEPPEPGAPNGPLFRSINRWLERHVVMNSDAIVTSTTHLRDSIRQRYGSDIPQVKTRAILNGFDEADFANFGPSGSPRGARLRIVHIGSINAEFRDPSPLFEAIARMVREGRLATSECDIAFIGGGPYSETGEVRARVDAAGLSASVSFLPRIPYQQALREASAADLLLLLQASDDTVGLVPAKLYEYLRAGKPTLALVRPGAVSELLNETGGGWEVDPRDSSTLDSTLTEIVAAWRSDRLAQHCADLVALRRFDRRALTAELACLFDEVCAGRRS